MGRDSVGWVVQRRRMHRTCALWLGLVALLILAWGEAAQWRELKAQAA